MTFTQRTANRCRLFWLFLAFLACALPYNAEAQQQNRLRHIQVLHHKNSTRINLFFQDPPDYSARIGAGRVRLVVKGADAPIFKRLRAAADSRIAGVWCARRNGGLEIVIPVKGGGSIEMLPVEDSPILSLEIGGAYRPAEAPEILPGREPILSGTERFVRDFAAPARAALPFAPTDVRVIRPLLSDPELQLFQHGEELLYLEQATEAVQVFSNFLSKPPVVRALAWYRLGEAYSLLDRNQEALAAFRQGETLWPGFLAQSPELRLCYAEARAKCGDFAGGRAMLVQLIGELSGSEYAAPLADRLAEMWARHGDSSVAYRMYRTVVEHAPGTPAAARARLKLADREMFTIPRERYQELLQRYSEIYQTPADQLLRDEALFRIALLQALYAPAPEALEASVTYDRRYPRGVFGTIVKKMREELLLPVYAGLYRDHDSRALAQLALDNREYLARCFGDPQFAPRLGDAFRSAGMLTQEIPLFSYLAERNWAAAAAPFLTARIAEDALTLGNVALAESTGRSCIARYPRDPAGWRVREELGRIDFEKGNLKNVAAELSFLTVKGAKPQFAESDYYLGKALASCGDQRGAESSLFRFTQNARKDSPLLPDGYFSVAGARIALKQYPGALAAYQQGGRIATGESADQFLYKTGELYLQLNMVRQAQESWEKLVKKGGGGTWVKLAGDSLNDLKWRLKISRELP
jgi:tetratricopeptide (TPR) repeat protein